MRLKGRGSPTSARFAKSPHPKGKWRRTGIRTPGPWRSLRFSSLGSWCPLMVGNGCLYSDLPRFCPSMTAGGGWVTDVSCSGAPTSSLTPPTQWLTLKPLAWVPRLGEHGGGDEGIRVGRGAVGGGDDRAGAAALANELVEVFGLRWRERAHAEVGTARTEVGDSACRRLES